MKLLLCWLLSTKSFFKEKGALRQSSALVTKIKGLFPPKKPENPWIWQKTRSNQSFMAMAHQLSKCFIHPNVHRCQHCRDFNQNKPKIHLFFGGFEVVTFLWKSFWRWCNAAVFSHKRRRLASWAGRHGWRGVEVGKFQDHHVVTVILVFFGSLAQNLGSSLVLQLWYQDLQLFFCQTSSNSGRVFSCKSPALGQAKNSVPRSSGGRDVDGGDSWSEESSKYGGQVSGRKLLATNWGVGWRLGWEEFPFSKNMEMSTNPKLKGKNPCDFNLEFLIWMLNFMEGTCKVAFRLRKGAWNLTNEHAPVCFLGTHLTFRFQSHFWVQRWSPRLLLDRVCVSLSYFRVVGPLLQVILRGWEEICEGTRYLLIWNVILMYSYSP